MSSLKYHLPDSKPQLVYAYVRALHDVYDVTVRVSKKTYAKFEKRERELVKLDVALHDYSYGVCILLERWVQNKGFTHVPVNVFLGDWAFSKYKKVIDSMTVSIDYIDKNADVELLYNELMIARLFVETSLIKYTRFSDLVYANEELLSNKWLEAYRTKQRNKLIIMALDTLSWEYGIKHLNSYAELVDKVVLNGIKKL